MYSAGWQSLFIPTLHVALGVPESGETTSRPAVLLWEPLSVAAANHSPTASHTEELLPSHLLHQSALAILAILPHAQLQLQPQRFVWFQSCGGVDSSCSGPFAPFIGYRSCFKSSQ